MSSSSLLESVLNEGKLLVHIAENGHSYEVDCDDSVLVEGVMRYIESVSGIALNDQLLLCLEVKLESQRPLSAYKLPANDREVFIFNKSRLQSNAPLPPPEQVDILDSADPPLPSSSHNPHPLDDAPDPALKALPSYERQFRYHFHRGHAIFSRTQLKFENCVRLLREQKVQDRALEVARGNLEQFYKIINQNCADFMKRYSQQHRIHSDLLVNLDRDIERLRSIKLHPALQTPTQKCLLDFVKEDNVRKSAENCSNSHRQFEVKVSQFKQMFGDVKRRVEELFSSRAPVSPENLERDVLEHQRFITEQKSIMQSLSKDVNTVKKLVDDCLSCQLSSSLRPHDAVSALGPMYEGHDRNHLPRMQACERAISKLLDFCKEKKNEMNIFLHNYMQKITYFTFLIKDVKLQFPVFREAMVRQDDIFSDLRLVRGIGPAYRACLAEVVRRKASMKLYMGMAGQLAERLALKRDVEIRRREEFLKANSSYIPRDVLASLGLYDNPNQCDVHIAPFDAGLIDIDISDVERFAPETLAGLSFKGEKHASIRGSSSASAENSHSTDAQDIVSGNLEKHDAEEFFESCDLVEIAGTSKMEVENAKLKAELASAIALICSFYPDVQYESVDDSNIDSVLKDVAEKTAEALRLKDEYGKHLQSMLKMKQMQCESYERRIQELEQKLSDSFLQGQKLSPNDNVSELAVLDEKVEACEAENLVLAESHLPGLSTAEPMDEVSCISNSLGPRVESFVGKPARAREGVDENMIDSSGDQSSQLDLSMMEQHREELLANDRTKKDKMGGPLGMSLTNSSTAESMPQQLTVLPGETAGGPSLESNACSDLLLQLQNELADKSKQFIETETKLKDATEEITILKRELEMKMKLLDESQMNCAHLENCLHEAREEAQTHLCAADRRLAEYNALRTSAVKMCSNFERLRSCVYASGEVTGFADSLRSLAQSLANTINDREDDGTLEFRKCIRVLADKVKHHEELRDKCRKLEAANEQLRKELEERKDLVKTLYAKNQLEKQANKEKISFGRLEVHEIAAFVRNTAGHYEAINRNYSNYFLSAESVALFADHLPSRANYIVGQIVHIERQIVKPLPTATARPDHGREDQSEHLMSDLSRNRLTSTSGPSSNPYGLPVGCEYFVVTVAMLPDTAIHLTPS